MEQWKSIKGYEGFYEVSTYGNIRSLDRKVKTGILFNEERIARGRVLKPRLKQMGYYAVDLSKDGKTKNVFIHRIVAQTFIPNPKNLKVVNHKNGIKTDNRIENLEWVSYKENHWHARKNGLLNNIGQYGNKKLICVETNRTFKNSVEAAKWIMENEKVKTQNVKVIAKNIRGSINGRTPKAYGYHWKDI